MSLRALVGRSREISDLEIALDRAIAGQGSVFLLSGEAGIGKTRLAEELTRTAEGRGTAVFWGRAWEAPGAPSCWPWVQVLGACLQTEQGVAFLERSAIAHDLGPLLPRERAAPGSNDAELEWLRLGSAIVALLQWSSREQPLVLVFDDLHASDLASLNLLQVVAHALRGLRVLVVGTYRELEARRTPTISALLAKLAREGTVRSLARLDLGAVTQWVAGVLGTEPSAALASAVFTATEGNPLFVDSLSQLLASRGYGASLPTGFALPDTIRETVRELLVRLSPQARDVLDAAAVMGRECPVIALQLVSGKPMDHVLAAVEEGIGAGALAAQPRASSPVRFAHVLIREALYQELPASQRIQLHASAARALVRLHSADLEEHLAELAHHTFEGAPVGSWLEAADFASRAARRAMNLFAFDDAARHFERAITALDHAELEDDARRADLLWRLGLCQIRAGQALAGKESCERSAALAKRSGQHETYARAALAWGSEPMLGQADPRLVDLLESALQFGTPDEALRVQVMARLAAAMLPTLTPERPLKLAREAMAAARALGDRRVLAEVLSTVRSVLFPMVASVDERTALDRELALLAVTLEDKLLELQAHGRLALDAMERGDPAAVRVELRIQAQLAEELRIPQYQLRAAGSRLMWATLLGDPDAIARAESDLRELSERTDDVSWLVMLEANRQVRAEISGDLAADASAIAALDAVLAGNPRLPSWPELGTWLTFRRAALSGDWHDAAILLPRFAPEGAHAVLGPILALVTPVCIHIGAVETMKTVYDAMLPFAAHNMIFTARLVSLGPVAYYLGALASALGQPERAAAHFREALAMCHRAGFKDFEARVGRAIETLGQPAESAPAPRRIDVPPRLEQSGEYWTLCHDGREVRLKDSKGLHYLAALLREPGREFHVVQLVGVGAEGDAGEWLDARAKAAYQQRVEKLTDALDDAESRGDREEAARLRGEREALADELARAVGLGGRLRKAGSAAERARINVQRRIRDVVARVSELDAAMGRHLELHVRTGVFCSWQV